MLLNVGYSRRLGEARKIMMSKQGRPVSRCMQLFRCLAQLFLARPKDPLVPALDLFVFVFIGIAKLDLHLIVSTGSRRLLQSIQTFLKHESRARVLRLLSEFHLIRIRQS